jgi:hypothetical protein
MAADGRQEMFQLEKTVPFGHRFFSAAGSRPRHRMGFTTVSFLLDF